MVPVTLVHVLPRLAIGLSGAWWLLFSVPAATSIWLPGDSSAYPADEGGEFLKRPFRIRDQVIKSLKGRFNTGMLNHLFRYYIALIEGGT